MSSKVNREKSAILISNFGTFLGANLLVRIAGGNLAENLEETVSESHPILQNLRRIGISRAM
jgi:hypothetical protein